MECNGGMLFLEDLRLLQGRHPEDPLPEPDDEETSGQGCEDDGLPVEPVVGQDFAVLRPLRVINQVERLSFLVKRRACVDAIFKPVAVALLVLVFENCIVRIAI